MKPSARLRTRPRCASLRLAIAAPWMRTSPKDGASRPPSRCSSVLLPDPHAPTTATRSPARTQKSMPSSSGTSSVPLRYVLVSPRHSRTGTSSFIAQRLGRIDFGRVPARVDRREQRERQRDHRNQRYVVAEQVRRQFADVVHALVQELDAEHALDERHDSTDVYREQYSADDADQGADH